MTTQLTLAEKAALLSGKNVWETRGIPRLGIPSLFLADGPHGVRKQLGSSDHLGLNAAERATCFPPAATVANSWDQALAEEIGAALGDEAVSLDVDVLLGPGLNIKRSPLCGRNFEYFSEDPYLSGKLAAGYVRGVQSRGVAATPKHFAANNQELRRMTTDSVVDERTLREIYLTAFEIVVREARPRAIMSSYNLVNGAYANEDSFLLDTVLRREWGFDGAVITDWGGGNDAVRGAASGSTIEMPSPGLDSVRQLIAAVEDGRLSEAALDARVAEAVALARGARPHNAARPPIDVQAHNRLARRAASSSVVLLKNSDEILPLAAGTRVGVVGDFADTPRYQGAGSSVVNPTVLTTAREAILETGLQLVGYAQGFDRHGAQSPELVSKAVLLAARSDVVLLYLGLDEISESEGTDRSHLELPANQRELLAQIRAVNPSVVVVLSAGSATEIPWLDQCAALVHGYLGGQAGAAAVLDVITGAVNPSGRLAETFPLSLESTPSNAYYPGAEKTAEYREGVFVGYRYYDTADVPVRFPFGFGLSYSSFEYSDLLVDDTGARFTITNTSSVDGSEVAQLYVGRSTPGVFRPSKELKGFAKVAVAAGQSVQLAIPFDHMTFRHFDVRSAAWEIERGEYSIMIGSHVADIRLSGSLTVEGTIEAGHVDPALACYATGQVSAVPDDAFVALIGRSLPASDWGQGPLGINDPLCRMADARSSIARLAFRILDGRRARAEARSEPDLNILFLLNMPFRSIAKMTNGAVSMQMVEALIAVVNGRFWRGSAALLVGAVRNLRSNARTRRELEGTE